MNTQDSPLQHWLRVCAVDEVPLRGARVVHTDLAAIAVFRTGDGAVFALEDRCPHKGGPLSQGLVFGRRVACPLHGWTIGLEDGEASAPDRGCARRYETRVEDAQVYLRLPVPGASTARPALPTLTEPS